jgi:hypothetical protein
VPGIAQCTSYQSDMGVNTAAITCCREKKMLGLIQKQDRLLYICFYLLLNLAEDVSIEKKMKKKVGR